MCVIIIREPDITIPLDKLELACDINKHGFGLSYIQNNRIMTVRSTEDNDFKEIASRLNDLKDRRVYLHLRHATVGAVTLDNSHPLPVLHKKQDKVDLMLMHNGTLWGYKPPVTDLITSDTVLFNRTFLTPLAKRVVKYTGHTKLLQDSFLRSLLDREANYSVFVLFDSLGNHYIVNEDRGTQFQGWWASNDYSFQVSHIRSSRRTTGFVYNRPETKTYDPFIPWDNEEYEAPAYEMADWEKELAKADAKIKQDNLFNLSDARKKADCEKIGAVVRDAIMADPTNHGNTFRDLKVLKTPFIQRAKIKSLDDMSLVAEKDLIELCQNHPIGMSQLIVDLFRERAEMAVRNKTQAKTILDLQGPEK